MEEQLRKFLNAHFATVIPLTKKLYLIHWEYDTTGDEKLAQPKKELEEQYVKIYLDQEKFSQLQAFEASGKIKDPLLVRQLQILLTIFRLHLGDKDHLERMVELDTEISSIYNHFRGTIDGKPHNNNQIKEILQLSSDNLLRRKAWEASKQIGTEVAEKVLELVRLRNKSAQKSGYSDYYVMSLTCKELDEKKMFATLDRLAQLTEQPFREAKEKMDNQLRKKLKIKKGNLRPWHYADPFFQEVPPGASDLNKFFADKDIEGLTRKTYESIGMTVDDILQRSSLYPKEGKCQHAYCTMIDRDGKDIRVLANISKTEYWTGTMLHEFGHAVYDKYLGDSLPHLLKTPAHTLSTEAIAMMMDALSKNKAWLTEMVGVARPEIDAIHGELMEQERLGHMIFARWGLVMVHFEREMYRNPDQDLNTLWWDYVEKYQLVQRPQGRNAPDWAAKIHLAHSPVYYQNYLYGQMVASQLAHYIGKNIGNGKLFNNPPLGPYLIDKYFKSGSQFDWSRTLEIATAESLNPDYYMRETLGVPIP